MFVRVSLLKSQNNVKFALRLQAQETLARDKDQSIRELLAAYPKLKPSVQMLLAKDEKTGVRKALAKGHDEYFGESLCEDVQLYLSRDREGSVRLALAENKHLHPAAQVMLAGDALASVRLKLVEESGYMRPLAVETQLILVKDHDSDIRKELAGNLFGVLAMPSEEEVQLALASDLSTEVKQTIINSLRFGSIRVSDTVRRQLLEGLDDDVRETVEEMLDSNEDD